jgi:hypothetical protein
MLLPNLGRDASTLATLQVGVAPGGQVAGTAADQSAFQLDGGNNSDDMAGNYSAYTTSNGGGPSGVVPTPVESVEEFKVGITNQTADFNGAAGSPGPDGDQARHQPVPWFALRLLFRD